MNVKKMKPTHFRLFISMFLIWIISSGIGNSQSSPGNITGKVSDASGEPLIGVSIAVKNTQIGTISDLEGNFSLKIPAAIKSPVLSFSYLGFATQEVEVKDKKHIAVKMTDDKNSLEEVIVIGYGTVARRDLTGAVDKVDLSEMRKAPVLGFDQSLAGRVAGVSVSSGEGTPGVDSEIVIRGMNSITQDNSPLYVIDGFPVEGSLSSIVDPKDIESMEILKDASATAIYGSRAANGVIMITTKTAASKEPTLTYDGFYGVQTILKTMDVMDGYEFVKLQGELYSKETMDQRYFFDGKTLENYRGTGIDFQDYLFESAPIQSHGISLMSGGDKTKYNLSLSYADQEGIIIKTGFKRYQGRLSIDQDVRKWLKMGVKASYSHSKRYGATPGSENYSATFNMLQNTWAYRPVTGSADFDLVGDLFDPDVDSTNDYRVNPIIAARNEIKDRITTFLMVNSYIDIMLPLGLKWRSTFGYNKQGMRDDQFNNSKSRTGNPKTGKLGVNASETYDERERLLNENTLSFKKKIDKKHNIDALAGVTFQKQLSIYNSMRMQQIPKSYEGLGMSAMDMGSFNTMSSIWSENRLYSWLGRINYNYNYKYYLTASFRADGSSKLAKGNQWEYFPSGSLMWRLSKEQFMKSLSFVSDAKIRVGWGKTGNNRVDDFASLAKIVMRAQDEYNWGNEYLKGSVLYDLGNPGLKWEITTQTNIGADLQFLNGRISLTTDLYKKTTDRLLLNAQLPGSSGFPTAFKNIGKVENNGLEITLNPVNINTNDFTWSTNFNISFNKNKVVQLAENQEVLLSTVSWDSNWNSFPSYIARLGEPMGQMFGYIYDGTYKYEDFHKVGDGYLLKDGIPYVGSRESVAPGDMKYRDINDDGVISDKDRTVIGRGFAKHIGGFTNTFRYKDFDLSVFFQWSYGNDILNANKLMLERAVKVNYNMYGKYANRWSADNPNSNIPRAGEKSGNKYSTYAIEDGSYLRLKSLTLGYNVPDALSKKVSLQKVRVYVSAQNLFTITDYSGMDPEVSVKSSALTPGFDFSAYPRARTFSVG